MIDLGATAMTAQEIDAYLREDGRFAAVATLRKDGSPFVIPLGYYYDGQYLYFSTTPRRGLPRRLRRDGRVSISVFDHEAIHGYVLINAVAVEVDDPDDILSLSMHHRYPKPGLENSEEHDRIWLSETRVVFRVPTADAFGMDQRKARGSIWALAMPDVAPPRTDPGSSEERCGLDTAPAQLRLHEAVRVAPGSSPSSLARPFRGRATRRWRPSVQHEGGCANLLRNNV